MIVFFHLNSSGFSATWALYFSVNQTSLTIHHHPTSPTFFFHNDTISDGGETPSFLIIFNDFTSQQSVPTSQDCVVYDKVSDQGPVWVRKDVIFQVQEKNIFILQNHSQMVLLGVWREDFTKKSPDHLFQVIRWSGAVLT